MKMFVFSMRRFDELPFFERYCPQYQVEYGYTEETPCLENLSLAAGYEVVNIITTPFGRPMLEKLHDMGVKLIATRTIGYDHIDTDYAKKLGMGIVYLSYSPDTVADYTVMMIIMGLRKLKHIMQRAAVQDYTLKGKLGRELRDCTVGVIGTGRIGRTVIRDLTGFGCRILAYDIYENDEVKKHAQYVDFDTLIRQSDVITLHAPASRGTYHMINSSSIDRMKDGVIIINCARGSLIDTGALISGLESGRVGYAGLDVIEDEGGLYYFDRVGVPLKNRSLALLGSFPNAMVTPHTAFYTETAIANMAENSIINSIKYMRGESTPFAV